MAGRFPGAADVEAFWQNLCEARDTIRHFDADTLDPAVSAGDRADPAYVPARGVVDHFQMLDASCFCIGPRAAALMAQKHRAFLTPCRECVGGCGPLAEERRGGSRGVYTDKIQGV